ncbi:hypothetical protein D3C72_1516170 [compost metagenome]
MRIDQAGQFDAGGGVLRQQVGGVLDQRTEVEGDVFEFELTGIELRQIEDIVEQFHQYLARVMGNRQLLLLFGIQRSVEGQRDHPEQAIEGRADFMAHVGQEHRAGFGHVEGGTACGFQFLVGLAQPGVDRLEFGGAGRDDVFQLAKVVGQAVFRVAPLPDFGGDVFELLVGNLDQYTDLIVGVPGGTLQRRWFGVARVATAEFTDHPHQGFGQHHIEERQQDAGQQQAAGEAIDQGHFGPAQEPVAEGVGIDLQPQRTQGFVG